MKRSEMRRLQKSAKKKKATYNLTEDQLTEIVKEAVKQDREEVRSEAVREAMILLLTIPLEVLMDFYWKKTYRRKLPEFTSHVLDYYEKWQNGELDMDELKKDLWDYGGVRFERSEK